MATNIEEILGKSINSVKELKEEIKRLQDALVQTDSDSEEWQSTTEKLVSAQKLLTDVTKAGKQAVEANATSIAGLEKEYKSLYNAYRLLSEEERKSPFGKEMANSLNELSTKLNDTKKEVGNFKDNIGRYSESAIDAFSKMGISIGGITQPIGQAKAAMGLLNKTMLANPVMWLLAGLKLLVEIFQRVGEAIKGNEESQMKLNIAMANFQPIIDAISNAFDWLGQKVVDLISFIGDLYSKWEVFRAGVTDWVGLTDNEKGKVQEQQRAYKDLAESQANLTKQKRENLKINATQRAELETLKNEAEATDDVTEKLEKLNKAKQLEEEITNRKIKEKEEELRLLKLESSFTANDSNMNDKLAVTEAELNQLRAEGATRVKELTTKIFSLTNAKNKDTKATKSNTDAQKDANDEAEKAKKLKEEEELKAIVEIQNRFKTEEQLLEEKYITEKDLLERYYQDTTKLTEEYNKKIAELRAEEAEKARREKINQRERDYADYNIVKSIELMDWENINDVSHNKYYEKVNSLRLEQYISRQEQLFDEIELENLTLDEKLKLYQEYYANLNALREEYRRADEAVYESKMNNVGSILNMIDAVGQLSNAISQNIELDIESGKISKQEAEKKKKQLKSLQAVQLAVSIATIAGDTAMGIMSLWTAFAKKKVANTQLINPVAIASANALDLATTIAQTAGMATMAGAQIAGAIGGYVAQVNSISQMGNETPTPTNTTPTGVIDTSSYTYTRELQTEEEKEQNQKSIVVYVDDIKRALDNRDIVNVETSF